MAPYAPPDAPESVARRSGLSPDAIIKLDANENPYGPSPLVAEALARSDRYSRYPDPDQKALRPLIASYVGVEEDEVLVGNGSDELIDLLCRIYLEPGDQAVDCTPTFGMYRFSTEVCGGRAVEAPRSASWEVDPQAVEAALSARTKLIFVASPNNPTGNRLPEVAVPRLLATGRIVVLDEAYVEFSSGPSHAGLVEEHDNLVVLRTFSKWAGLAGLRVGYGVFPPETARHLWKVKPPFNVNVAAEAAVRATLGDLPAVQQKVRLLMEERDRMAGALGAIDAVRIWPSDANFLLVETKRGTGAELKDHLAARGIAVRAYSHPRLERAVRVSVGLPQHTDAVVAAVREWGADGG